MIAIANVRLEQTRQLITEDRSTHRAGQAPAAPRGPDRPPRDRALEPPAGGPIVKMFNSLFKI